MGHLWEKMQHVTWWFISKRYRVCRVGKEKDSFFVLLTDKVDCEKG
jgi:hypothetical protein